MTRSDTLRQRWVHAWTRPWARLRMAARGYAMVLVMAIAGLTAYSVWDSREEALVGGRKTTAILANLLEAQTRHAFESADQSLLNVERMLKLYPPDSPARAADLNALLHDMAGRQPHVFGIYVTDRSGRVIHSSSGAAAANIDVSDRAYFQAHRERADLGLFVGPPVTSRVGGARVINLSRRLNAADGAFDGVVAASIISDYFQNFYTGANPGMNGAIMLFLRDGTLLFRSPAVPEAVGASNAGEALFTSMLPAASSGSFRGNSPFDGMAREFSYRALDGLPLVVVAGMDERRLLAEWNRYAKTAALLALIVILVSIVLTESLAREAGRREALAASLKDSEKHYRGLFENNPHPVWVMDEQTLRIVSANPAAVATYGYTLDEFRAMTVMDLQYPDDRTQVEGQIRSRSAAETRHYQRRHVTKDGRIIDAEVTAQPFTFGGRPARMILVDDVTERWRAEQALRESEQRYRHLFEANPLPMWVRENGTLRFLAVNNAAVAAYGYSRQEFLSMTTLDIRPPEDTSRYLHDITLQNDLSDRCAIGKHRRKDGTVIDVEASSRPFEFDGKPVRLTITNDITDRRRAEIEHAHLAAIVENTNDAIISRQADGTLLTWNRGAEKIFGYAAAEMVGQNIAILSPPESRNDALRNTERLLKGEAVPAFEAVRIAKDGRRVDVQVSVSAIRDAGGDFTAVASIFRDISEHKRAEAARTELAAIVENSNDAIIGRMLDGAIMSWNAGAERMFGYTAAQAIGQSISFIYPEGNQSRFNENSERLLGGELIEPHELQRRTKDGRIIDVLASLSPVRDGAGHTTGVSVMYHDITAIKQAETALKDSEERFRAIFEQAGVGIALRGIDPRQPRWLRVNQKLCDILGYTREELLQLSSVDLTPPEDRDVAIDYNEKLGRGEVAAYTREKRYVHKNGTFIWASISLSVLRGPDGTPAHIISVIRDITDRKEIEARFRATFEQAAMGLMHTTLDRRILLVNRKFSDMIGYSTDELTRMRASQIHHPEDTDKDRHLEQQLLNGEIDTYSFEKRYIRKDGGMLWCNRTVSLVRDEQGRPGYFIRVIEDISERIRIAQTLRDSEERLRTITDNVPALIGYVDLEERFQFVNRTYEEWLGIAHDYCLGRQLREILDDEAYTALQPHIRLAYAGKPSTFERVHNRGGQQRLAVMSYIPDHDAQDRVRGFYFLAYDVTERKLAEEAMARERTLLRTVIDNLPDRIYVKDSARRFMLVNRSSLGHHNLATDRAILGKTSHDILPRKHADAFDAEDRAVLESGEPLIDREAVMETDDGNKTWVIANKVPLRDAAGKVFGLIGIHRDITQIRQSAEAIEKLNAELEQRVIERTAQMENTNRELESFAYSVSHDLRAPLRSIDGFSKALLDDYSDRLEPTALDYLRRVRAASQRMAVLIDDMLSLSRITRSEMRCRPTDLSALAEDIIAELSKEQPQRIIDFSVAGGIRVNADPGLVRVALDNLLRNAWKFSGKQPKAAISVGVNNGNGGQPVYFVRDNGAGFDMRYADKLFGAFQRLHREADFAGTGIGLATVHRIIHRHGGQIWAEAAVGKGATFFFTLGKQP